MTTSDTDQQKQCAHDFETKHEVIYSERSPDEMKRTATDNLRDIPFGVFTVKVCTKCEARRVVDYELSSYSDRPGVAA